MQKNVATQSIEIVQCQILFSLLIVHLCKI